MRFRKTKKIGEEKSEQKFARRDFIKFAGSGFSVEPSQETTYGDGIAPMSRARALDLGSILDGF